MSNDEYEVGYKKPPVKTQFKKGQSGNPNGRPKESKNMTTILTKELNCKIFIKENGVQTEVTKLEAMVKHMVNKAVNGDHRSQIKMLSMLQQIDSESNLEDLSDGLIDAFDEDDEQVIANIQARFLNDGDKKDD